MGETKVDWHWTTLWHVPVWWKLKYKNAMHLIIWYWGQTTVQGVENDFGSSTCSSDPDLSWGGGKQRNTTWRVKDNIMGSGPGNTNTTPLFSSTPEVLPLALLPQITLNSNPNHPLQPTAGTTSPSLPAFHSLTWSLSSQLPEPYLFTPGGILHFLSSINKSCTGPILLTFLRQRPSSSRQKAH